jgi:drug/metabolite transporter (DMT)-like permease
VQCFTNRIRDFYYTNVTPTRAALPWISLVTVWILWGSTFLGIRVAVQSIPPLLMAGSRYLCAGVLMALILWALQRERLQPVRWSDMKSVLITAVLLLVAGNGSLSWAELQLHSGLAALIVAGVPIWMLLINAVFSGSLQRSAAIGILIGTIGMIVLVGMPSAHVPIVPALAVIGGSMAWALGSVLARRQHSDRTHPLFPALEMIVGGALLCVIAAIAGEFRGFHPASISAASGAGYIWLVVMGSMVAYTAYGYAVRTLPTNVVSTYAYVNPIVAVMLGALILAEPLSLNIIAGGATIITAVVIILIGNRRKEKIRELDDAA